MKKNYFIGLVINNFNYDLSVLIRFIYCIFLSPIYTIFLPIPILPSGNGKVWEKNAMHYTTVNDISDDTD